MNMEWTRVPQANFDDWFKKPLPNMPTDEQQILVTAIEERTGKRYVSIDECYIEEINGDYHYELSEAWRRWGEDVIAGMPLPEPYEVEE